MSEQVSLQTKLYNLLQERQFYWWLGHVCVVFNGLVYFNSVLSLNTNLFYYKRAYLGALLSYAIVIYNSIGVSHTKFGVNFLCDENVHYFIIAFYWYSFQPITVTLIPFFIFSIFHTLTFIKSHILPLTNTTKDIPKDDIIKQLENKIQQFTDNYQKSAMTLVAYTEVIIILGRILLGIIMLRTSVLALIVFIHFLRLRYLLSNYTREALKNTTVQLDKLILESPTKKNAIMSNIYISIKKIVIKYGAPDQQYIHI